MGAQESKLSFRRGIFRLHEERNIPEDDPYWTSFWTLPESAEDVFTLFSPTDIRKARDDAPENIETLVVALCKRLFHLRYHPDFPSEQAPEQHLLNCLRVLTRLIPFLFEENADNTDAVGFLWSVRERAKDPKAVSYTKREDALDNISPRPASGDTGTEYNWRRPDTDREDVEPMAEELMKVLIELLFFCGFTIPANYGSTKVVYGIWETGVGCSVHMGTTKQFESNKIETLRCLLSLISRGMYVPATEMRSNRHITHMVTMIPKNIVLALLCSLLNTTIKFNPTTWRNLPYSANFLSDSRQLLVSYSLQFLLVILCYPLPKDGQQVYSGNIPDGETEVVNQFRYYFKKLHRANDFNFMVDGMSRILQQPLSASTSYLPGSQKPIRFYPEMMLLFWESLQQNKRFRSFLVETDRALDFLVVLLFYALEHKTDPAQIGLVRMCVFILQPLSAEPKFSKSLNKVFEGQASLPASVRIPSFHGTYGDFLIISIYTLIATSKGQLVSLYSALFMTLANVAPYTKNISVMASTKLMQLFSSISQPSFLFANDSNFRLLQYLLEIFNSMIEHNFNQNPHLSYAILRSHRKFEALQDLTLTSGLEHINQIRKAREERRSESKADESNEVAVVAPSDQPQPVTLSIAADGSKQAGDATQSSQSKGHKETSRNSSISELDFPPPSPRVMSEKARGKLPQGAQLHRQDSSSSLHSTHSISRYHSGPMDFVPSGDWFDGWYPELEMSPIVAVLDQLAEEVTRLSQETPDPRPIIKFLQKAELTNVTAQTPNPRTFVWSDQAKVWFESLLFGYIYIAETQLSLGAVGVWTGTNVRLFRVQAESSNSEGDTIFKVGHNAVDAMTSSFVQRFGNLGMAVNSS